MKLLVFLADTLRTFEGKGEVKPRYYNPDNMFSEVHFVSPANEDLGSERLQCLVGEARMMVHTLGASYGAVGFPPFRRLGALVKAVFPDVIRAYDPGVRGSLAVFWGKRLGVPSVISVHADLDDQRRHEQRPIHYVRKLLERYALSRADAVVCVSRYLEPYAKRYGAHHTVVIYNRVYPEQFASPPDDRHGPTMKKVTILSVGRLVRQKYQECLIRAVQGLDVTLILIGDGELRERLTGLVRRLRMENRVEFIRAIPHAEMPRYYRAADIFAVATHYEGFCIPVLEAMAAGLPVVASGIGPIEELVGDAGFLVENRPEAFAEVLGQLIKDPALRKDMGERARRKALTMDGALMERQERALYESLVQR